MRDTVIIRIPSLSMLLSQPECSATKLTSCICSTRLAAPKSCVHWPTMGSAWPLSKSSLTGYREIRQSSSSVFLLTGYCSIEGTAQYNDRLSSTRAHSLQEYLLDFYPWMKDIMYTDAAERIERFAASGRTERQYGGKNAIERIILNTGVYEGRERKLMDLYGGEPTGGCSGSSSPRTAAHRVQGGIRGQDGVTGPVRATDEQS